MKYYFCKKCNQIITNPKKPSSFNCMAGGLHKWKELGEVGNINYQCKKCGILIKVNKKPSSFNCPKGGLHRWVKL